MIFNDIEGIIIKHLIVQLNGLFIFAFSINNLNLTSAEYKLVDKLGWFPSL